MKVAKGLGILSESEIIDSAIQKGWWSREKEKSLSVKKDYVKRMSETRSKALLSSQKKELDKLIEEENKNIFELESERAALVLESAEVFAGKKIEEFYISNNCFLSKDFSKKLFDNSEFEYVSDAVIKVVSHFLFSSIKRISYSAIHFLAASQFFQEIIRSCPDDSAYEFYGIPSVKLTTYQNDLFILGNYYKKAIKNSPDKIPNEVLSDPESLIKWFSAASSSARVKEKLNRTPNAKKTKGERTGRISSFVGATEEDYKDLGLKTSDKDLISLARDSGGSLDMTKIINSI